jgi:hypothetical protein
MVEIPTRCRCALLSALLFLAPRVLRADCLVDGFALNHSYTTLCAEVDNVNIPLLYSNASAYRITATHPSYYPWSVYDGGADFTDCPTLTDDGIWLVGLQNGSTAEFLTTGFSDGDMHYATDNPAAGLDEASTNFPNQLNATNMRNQYIWFTANEAGDANTELKIGAELTVAFVGMIGTQQVAAETWDGTNWISRGVRTFSHPTNLVKQWDIPDFTWNPGTDTNAIHLHVVGPTGGVTSADALAFYDYVELRKRDQLFESVTTLFDDGVVVVHAVNIDFWWRAPEKMTVSVVGGGTHTNAHYFRMARLTPTNASWNQFFILYEDGNARILPLPPNGPYFGHFGASVILGPSADAARPFSAIDTIAVDPDDFSLDITYENGGTAHAEIWSDRERTVVDVDPIAYNTTTQSFARVRSMWVHDGKHDIDRVQTESGSYPAVGPWTAVSGSWWRLKHEVPSYHNTYAPDFEIAVIDDSQAFLSREAESLDAGSNYTVVARTNAGGGSAIALSAAGGEATYAFTLQELHPDSVLLLRYSDVDGGDNGNNPGNLIEAYVDGAWKARTWSMNTGGSNAFEWAPDLSLGDLSPGTHSVRVVTGPLTQGVELDLLRLVSRPTARWATNIFLSREAESVESGAGYTLTNRAHASGGSTLKMSATGGTASYTITLTNAVSNVYGIVRYAEDLPPNKVELRIDGSLRGKFPSQITRPSAAFQNHALEKGTLGTGNEPSYWWRYGSAGHEDWAAQTGHRGVGFYTWLFPENYGGFGQNLPVTNALGHIYTFTINGYAETHYTSATKTTFMKMEFWKSGEPTNRYARTNSIYNALVASRNTWVPCAMTVTNLDPAIDEVRSLVAFSEAVNLLTNLMAAKWDNAYFVQTGTNDWDYFTNAPALFLGDLGTGVHTFVLATTNESFGIEIDRFELATLDRVNRAPALGVPSLVTVPVGSTTGFTVTAYENDPDCLLLVASNAPAGATFVSQAFSWTPGAASAGTTSTVQFVANDQSGAGNGTVASNVVLVVPFDSDTNGIGDGWEWTYFTNLGVSASADPDADQVNNLREFVAGTVPGDGASFFSVTDVVGSVTRLINVPTQPGRKYTIQYADGGLTNGMEWLTFGSTNNGAGTWLETNVVTASFTFVDDGQAGSTGGEPASGVRHYRVRVELP